MTVTAGTRSSPSTGIAARPLVLPLALGVIIVLLLPLFFARPAHLTSDESLYLAEAYNIAHGDGLTYPSGDPITHRAPLQPLLLAPAVALAGTDAAYDISKLVVAANALLVLLLAWRMGGAIAGAIAGVAAAASAYLNGFGATLYLDPLQCSFMLLCLLALHDAATRPAPLRSFVLAGALLGLAFLVKESAVQWSPLGVLAWLFVPSLRSRQGARGAVAFTATFAATVAPWWVWVWLKSGELFLLGEPSLAGGALVTLAAISFAALAIAVVVWPDLPPRHRGGAARLAMPAAGALVIVWAAFMLYGLTAYSTWPFPNDYLSTVPRYLRTVAPQAQPSFALVAAVAWLLWRARTSDAGARLLVAGALLFVPFALFIANRGLQLRDALPLVYLAYVTLGIAASAALRSLQASIDDRPLAVGAGALIALASVVFAVQQVVSFRSDNEAAASVGVRADSWDSAFVHESAAWMNANLPPGARVLSSRLYFSALHVQTGARFEIRQMPTVRVDVDPARDGLLTPRANLFRWGDGDLRAGRPGDRWLALEQFPGKGYWVGLSQQELMEYIGANESDYVILTGEDVAFSTLSYAAYFQAHPAFTLLYYRKHSSADQLFVFAVDRARLGTLPWSTAISPASFASLQKETGMTQAQLSAALGTPLRVTDTDAGLSDREQWAAAAGLDLAAVPPAP